MHLNVNQTAIDRLIDREALVDKLIVEKEVLEICPFGKTTLWSKIKNSEFPAPRRVTPHRKAWIASEVQEWIKSRPVVEQYVEQPEGKAA